MNSREQQYQEYQWQQQQWGMQQQQQWMHDQQYQQAAQAQQQQQQQRQQTAPSSSNAIALLSSAVEDLTAADATLRGASILHDGRVDAKLLVASAHRKYQEANVLLNRQLPLIQMAEVKANMFADAGQKAGGSVGQTAGGLTQTAINVVLGGSLIHMIAKKSRTKKAVRGVGEMLQAYQQVLGSVQQQARMPYACY
jgi:hypothetical protein